MRDDWTALEKLIFLRGSGVVGGAAYETISGNPVSFAAKAAPLKQLKVAFSPKQDLHGYDAPWPAGAGKNLLNVPQSVSLNSPGYLALKIQINLPAGTYTLSFNCSSVGSTKRFQIILQAGETQIFSQTGDIASTVTLRFTTTQAADNVTIFCNNSNAATYTNAMIESGSTATAYSPYSNLCPILGWDSLNVEQRGKNLLPNDISAYSDNDAYYYIHAIMPLNTLAVMSLADRDTSVDISGCYIGFIGDYNGTGSPTKYKWVINNGTISADKTNVEQTPPRTGKCEGIFIYPGNAETFNKLFSRFNIQVELGTTATEYVPYNPLSRSISINLGSTVYSGTVDVVTGVVTVTHGIIDMSNLEWSLVSVTYGRWASSAVPNIKSPSTGSEALNGLAEEYKIVTSNAYNNVVGTMYTPPTGVSVQVCNGSTTIKPKGNLVYELATPLTIQLTPQEVESLAGDNTMWSDANGDLTVEYRSN